MCVCDKDSKKIFILIILAANGAAHLKNVDNCLNTNIYSYLETSGGQSSKLYLNVLFCINKVF